MIMSQKLKFLVTLLCLTTSLASAQQNVREVHKQVNESEGVVPGARKLRVRIDGGAIRLEGTSGDRISYLIRHKASDHLVDLGRTDAPLYRLTAYTRGDTSWLVAIQRDGTPGHRLSELLVRVPRAVRYVKLETSGGDVSLQGVAGRVEIQTGGGRVQVDDVGGVVGVETGGQDIDVGSVGGDGRFHTGGGKISVRYIKGNLDAFTGGGNIVLGDGMQNAVLESGAGDVRVTFCGGTLKAQSGGGNLVLGDVGGPADIRTSGGNLRLHSAKGFVQARTTAGNIELEGVPAADATTEVGSIVAKFSNFGGPRQNSALETSLGDITVFLPSDLPVTVRASVDLGGGHTISSELPDIRIVQDGVDSNGSIFAEGELKGGGPGLRVHTSNGSIHFRKLER